MSSFWTLFKQECRNLFSPGPRRRKFDLLGRLLSFIITALIIVVFVFLISAIADGYATIKVNKLNDPYARSVELLNLIYTIAVIALSILCVEKMRSTLTKQEDQVVYLRLPIEPGTIFLSKLATLLLWNSACSLLLILPINIIFFVVLDPPGIFWIYTIFVCLFLPIVPFFIATVLLVPYIYFINFIKDKYVIIFILLSGIVMGAFMLYAEILSTVQSLIETGSIKFLFNAEFVNFLRDLTNWTYPANAFASIALGQNIRSSLKIILIISVIGATVIYIVPMLLYSLTLYKNESQRKSGKKKRAYRRKSVFSSLIGKEFISVFREPKHLFSYFAIAAAMPIMVYTCYTLFETLIYNALGLSLSFPLALIVMLIFGVLTNTFCATNVTRDGLAALKSKVFPIKASRLLLSKVIFCSIVSSLAVLASAGILAINTPLRAFEGITCTAIAFVFSLSQIFIATRLDLNHARLSASEADAEKATNRTVTKTVVLGLIVAVIMGISSMVIAVYANTASGSMFGTSLNSSLIYIVPSVICALYLAGGILYYTIGIEKSFDKLVK